MSLVTTLVEAGDVLEIPAARSEHARVRRYRALAGKFGGLVWCGPQLGSASNVLPMEGLLLSLLCLVSSEHSGKRDVAVLCTLARCSAYRHSAPAICLHDSDDVVS